MRLKAITTALLCTGTTMSGQALAQASNPYNADWLVYSVNQVCQVWWNGVTQCIPVALMGPAPARAPYPLDNLTARAATPPSAPAQNRPATPAVGPRPEANPYLAYVTPPVRSATAPAPVMRPTAMAVPQPARVPALPIIPAWPSMPSLPTLAWPTLPTPLPPQTGSWPFGAAPGAVPTAPVLANAPETNPTAPAPQSPPTPPMAMSAPVSQDLPASPSDVATPPTAPVPALVHFEFDSDRLTPAGQQILDQWLDQHRGDGSLRLTGHADRLGPLRYNAILSRRRADAVLHYLTSKGMRPNDIQVLAKGETDPVTHCPGGASDTTKDCLAPNRRVEIQPL